MLHTILLACCLSQFSVSVERPSFTVEVEKTKQEEYDDFYVVMFTATWCGPCRNYKDSGKLAQLEQSIKVRQVDIDVDQTYYNGRVPRFWLCKNKLRVHEFPEGAVDPDKILDLLKQLKTPTEELTTYLSIYDGKPGSSHESRETLIKHLLNDGVHKGKHSLDKLNRLNDTDLDKLHSLDHN